MQNKKVLVCGGRDFCSWRILDEALKEIYPELIIQGGAIGADFLSKVWAIHNHVRYKEYPANWRKYGRSAGIIRNQEMIDEEDPTLVVAFKGGRGTKDMIQRAEIENIPIKIIGGWY